MSNCTACRLWSVWFMLAACAVAALPATAGTVTWTGANETNDWHAGGNWLDDMSVARVPASGDDVVLANAGAATHVRISSGPVLINTLTGSKELIIDGAVLNIASDSTLGSPTIIEHGSELTGSGNIEFTGSLIWRGTSSMTGSGRTIIAPGASLTMTSFRTRELRRILENHSSNATWTDGQLNLCGGTLNNELDGVLSFTGAANRLIGSSCGTNAVNNAGTFNKTGTGLLDVHVPFNNSGTCNLDQGTLIIGGAGMNSGTIDVDAGATLKFNTSYTYAPASSLTGMGTLLFASSPHNIACTLDTDRTFEIAGGSVFLNAPYTITGVVNLTAGGEFGGTGDITIEGALNWTTAGITGTGQTIIKAGATLTMNHVELRRTLINRSSDATWTGGDLGLCNGTLINEGVLDCTGSGNRNISNGCGPNVVNNAGTFNKTGTGLLDVHVPFNNSGECNIQSGTLVVAQTYVQTAGTTSLSGGNLTMNSTIFDLQGGMLTGTGTLTGDVVNTAGILAPGLSPGTLTIAGHYTQHALATMAIELGGLTPDSEFDVLSVDGNANLNGTLLATLTFGYDPTCGDTLQFLNAGNVVGGLNGSFLSLSAPDAPLAIEVLYSANSATIRTLGGDMNCDDLINGLDVQAFVLALTNPAGYATEYPSCDILNADFIVDAAVTQADAAAFVQHLMTGACP